MKFLQSLKFFSSVLVKFLFDMVLIFIMIFAILVFLSEIVSLLYHLVNNSFNFIEYIKDMLHI